MVNHGNKMMLGDGDTIPISECALKVNNVGGTKDVMFYFNYYYFSHLVSVTSNDPPPPPSLPSFYKQHVKGEHCCSLKG